MRRLLLLVIMSACSSGSGPGPDADGAADDSDVPSGGEDGVSGVWELLSGGVDLTSARLHGAAVYDGDLYVAAADPDRVRFWRFGRGEAPVELDTPGKVHNTSGARLVSAGDALLALVPITAGGAQIDVFRIEGDALVALDPIAAGASTAAGAAVTSADGGAAVAYVGGDGTVQVQRWRSDVGWTEIGEPIPAATPEAWPGDLSLAWSDAGYLLGFGRNVGQERFAHAWRLDAEGWEELGPPEGIPGSPSDVAWLGDRPHLLASIPTSHLWAWREDAWQVELAVAAGEERFDLRQSDDASTLYWFARGGLGLGNRLERFVTAAVPLPDATTTGVPLEVGPFALPPRREILSVGGELYWVYDDELGNLWKVHVARWVPG